MEIIANFINLCYNKRIRRYFCTINIDVSSIVEKIVKNNDKFNVIWKNLTSGGGLY